MNYYTDIEPGKNPPEDINVIVEIPKGGQNKFEYDKKNNIFRLDRVLFSPFHYPGDYGFVPRTLAKDGDPMDALVMISHPTFPGILIGARPIGVLKMKDSGEQDDKILCVSNNDIRFEDYGDIGEVRMPILNEIAHFFQVYKQLEGKDVEIVGWGDLAEAKQIILDSIKAYEA
ncbi:MAG: inorganic diphosphatase [Phycisphaerae bacterium]|nr:inorganic diphosphatase [Phycisphaerae bacterium]